MKNIKIQIDNQEEKSEDRKALEWGIHELERCETIEELKDIWHRFAPLQKQWQFVEMAKQMKRKILYEGNS